MYKILENVNTEQAAWPAEAYLDKSDNVIKQLILKEAKKKNSRTEEIKSHYLKISVQKIY